MRIASRAGWLVVPLAVVFVAPVLIRSRNGGGTQWLVEAQTSQQNEAKPPPIPAAGPFAEPKSLKQMGLPAAATQAATPADNPQTPEKSRPQRDTARAFGPKPVQPKPSRDCSALQAKPVPKAEQKK